MNPEKQYEEYLQHGVFRNIGTKAGKILKSVITPVANKSKEVTRREQIAKALPGAKDGAKYNPDVIGKSIGAYTRLGTANLNINKTNFTGSVPVIIVNEDEYFFENSGTRARYYKILRNYKVRAINNLNLAQSQKDKMIRNIPEA